MSVVAALIPAHSEARVGANALKFGIGLNAEVIERKDGKVFIDLVGDAEKCLRSLLGSGATVLDVTSGYESGDAPAYDRIVGLMKANR